MNKSISDKYHLINIKNLKFKYKKNQDFYDLDINELRIKGNQIVSLLGPSGSGKTTLLNLLLGYLKPTEGEIIIKDNPKTHEIAYIMQENSIYENVSVFDNIFLSAKNYQKWVDSVRIEYFDEYFSENQNDKLFAFYLNYVNSTVAPIQREYVKKWRWFKFVWKLFWDKKVKNKFKILHDIKIKNLFKKELNIVAKKLGIDELLNKNVNELSGGQKQRVAFAKGIIKKTKLVLMDEPFSALDAKIKESTIDWLLKIKKEFNLSIVIVTHDQHDALKISDKIILLDKGVVQQYSTGDKMYENPQNLFVAKFIGSPEINFIETKGDYSYYIRQNKIELNAVRNGKYKITGKKHFGDSVLYYVEIDPNLVWQIVLKNEDIRINQRVNIKYMNSDVLVFNKNGDRIYGKN
ncbi:ATP-binding cassette domain-containing protein [Mycoplasma zalophidermidis]|uniref:ABC transporter ATP-binding protein n=1 Tax=Mycoplasma zalophidermidis TaxID=398174 RepID=A0ABS6DRV3_9MOLU|nr:ABC transporter ATP-binding protein [Mycoplasma zalophidermidis]MBU4689628.1 ABC transporter ATP-binding protein [Mycoplasma zalophidermidis]MBU4693526.1 ABC transporter ATP-binding protein [Mycoplasma zalophidermidis]MCR8966514.1 ABC transporter ATP-binding protein [Mycoplasma zalophidermidis]